MKYRSEIDGLRAIAVLAVILFHARVELFQGGFVGVDVFFVISGFLITKLIAENLDQDKFSLADFYIRRVRRIFPALILVLFCSIPAAYFLMSPTQFYNFSQSSIAAMLFSANFFFWKESSYFTAIKDEMPLVHTWSLSVEEQFYLLFPLFLLFVWRWGRSKVFWLLAALSLISLVISEWGWRNSVNANFYMTPSRAWELLAGSLTALFLRSNTVTLDAAQDGGLQTNTRQTNTLPTNTLQIKASSLKANNVLSLIGLSAIIYSVVAFSEFAATPSVATLLPVGGTVLVILFGVPGTLVNKWLSTRVLVGLGLISYSTYLWHQPVFAFARLYFTSKPPWSVMALLVVLSLLLSWLSWRWIEKPFRDKRRVSNKCLVVCVSIGVSSVLFIGLMGHFRVLTPLNLSQHNSSHGLVDYAGDNLSSIELEGEPEYLLVGDSHAVQYLPSVRRKAGRASLISEPACLSLPGLVNSYQGRSAERANCKALYQAYFEYLDKTPSIHTVIIAHRYGKTLADSNTGVLLGNVASSAEARIAFEQKLVELLSSLLAKNRKVVLIGNLPSAEVASNTLLRGYQDCLYRYGKEMCPTTYPIERRAGQVSNQILDKVAEAMEGVEYYDPAMNLCDSTQCFIVKDQSLIYSDYAHLTAYGADLVIEGLLVR